jgi:colanic acid/amylovoran biosynthesis glycosyltransferase
MRIIYVTAEMPYGPAETFIIDEIREVLLRHDVLVVPRSPAKLGPHAAFLAGVTRRESLLSPRVLASALAFCVTRPGAVLACMRTLLRSCSLKVALGNFAVLPKALWLARAAADWKAEHIHCHWAGTTATMAMIASELSGIPWSLTTHRSDIVGNNLLALKAKSATMVRAISEDGRKMMIERGVDPDRKLRVLPMGVQIPRETSLKPPPAAIVLCPADLLKVKGHRFLLEAWHLLRNRGVAAQLWLAGDGELRATLEKFADDLHLCDSVRFLGTIKHQDLLDLYSAGKVSAVVLASIDLGGGCHEGIPVALVEAMSYAVPVIATTTGGIPELVAPHTGLLVPPEDPVALAAALESILQDATLARRVGRQGRRRVMETRDVVCVAAELESCWAGASERIHSAALQA